jgi:uncharacterized protein YcaQ
VQELTPAEVRRAALAAQGFADRRLGARGGRVDARHLRAALTRLHLLQIDSVNVLARSHELPLFSRLGPYPRPRLRALLEDERAAFEYWAHEASYVAVALHPLLRWRMATARGESATMTRLVAERPDLVERVYAEVAERGPVTAAEVEADPALGRPRRGTWWSWGDAKIALEFLFYAGRITAARRLTGFQRAYDLTERVLPAEVLAAPTPEPDDAKRALLVRAAAAIGVGSAAELADYFRLGIRESRRLLAEVVEDGSLEGVRVAGWREPAFLHPGTLVPRRVRARALLSPFDSLIWHRPRTERVFGTQVRLEVYTPAPKRVHGYYVLPFLLGDRIVGRVDLKADRNAGVLRAQASWAEPGVDHAVVADELADELRLLAGFLGLRAGVEVVDRGDLAPTLRRAVAATYPSAGQ